MPPDAPAFADVRPFAEIARGPVASVFKAFDAAAGEVVLLKALRPGAAADPERRARFADEARLAATVCHANVVRVRRVADDGGALVADWVEGRDLQAVLDADGALPAALAAYVAREAARGLAAVHAAGIVHRDVKPANVLLGLDGSVRITDFGLASLAPAPDADTSSGAVAADTEVRGTLATLAPEVVRGGDARPAADLFALGAVLAYALTGRSPFAGATASDTLDAVLHADAAGALAADPRVPLGLAAVAAGLLDRDPAARPTATDLADRLDGLMDALGRAEAGDLAAFLESPAAYRPPAASAPAAGEPATSDAEVSAASALPVLRPARSARRAAVGLAAAALATLAVVVWARPEPRPGPTRAVPSETPAAEPVLIGPASTDTFPNGQDPTGANSTDTTGATRSADPTAVPPEGTSTAVDAPVPIPPVVSPPSPSLPARTGPERPADPPAGSASAPPVPATPAGTGLLVVASEPWAAVRVDGRAVGTTPVAPLALAAGLHEVTFENPGFPTHTMTVRVAPGETVRAAVSLWSLVARVRLDVAPWAEVWVDGRRWDTVPPQARPLVLAPGAHTLRFEHPTLGRREATLRVAAGEERTLQIRMTDPGR